MLFADTLQIFPQDFNFTFKFQYQANLLLAPHTAVMEQ